MSLSNNSKLLSDYKELIDISNKDVDYIKEFINSANSRLDAINLITKNSHAIAADAVTNDLRKSRFSQCKNIYRYHEQDVCLFERWRNNPKNNFFFNF